MFEQIVRYNNTMLPKPSNDDPVKHNEPLSKTLAWAVGFGLIGGTLALIGLWAFALGGPRGHNGAVIIWLGALAAFYFAKRQFCNAYEEYLYRRDELDKSDTIHHYPEPACT